MKPRVFIGSSSENRDVALAIQENLDRDATSIVWEQGVFGLSNTAIESLTAKLATFDFGIFVFAPDDEVVKHGVSRKAVRDNVLFELGLFIGRLGRSRSFI